MHSTTKSKQPTIWVFVVADSVVFGLLFLVFMAERYNQPTLFAQSAKLLDPGLGLANTLILITSSALVAGAVAAARAGDDLKTSRLLWAGFAVALGFAAIKLYEYALKISSGISLITDGFMTFYFMLTGIHFLHYIAGLVILLVMAKRVKTQGTSDSATTRLMVSGAIFWHLVDLLWVFIFSMLYLLGAP